MKLNIMSLIMIYPYLKPRPRAVLLSLVTETLASLHVSLSMAWLSASKSDPSAGYRPEKTICFAGLKPSCITKENILMRQALLTRIEKHTNRLIMKSFRGHDGIVHS